MITISKGVVRHVNGEFVLAAKLSGGDGTLDSELRRELWFSIPEQYADFVEPENNTCFLLGMLYFAMHHGQDIHLEGAVSPVLLERINSNVVQLTCAYTSRVKPIKVTAAETREFPSGSGVGTGFSGGVDSFSVFLKNYYEPPTPERRITELFFFNVGTHGLGDTTELLASTEAKFRKRHEKLRGAPDEIGVPFIPIDSNMPSFLPDNIASAISFANGSAIHFVSRHISLYFVASCGYNYSEFYDSFDPRKADHRVYLDHTEPFLLPMISTPALTIVPEGMGTSRIEKIAAMLKYPVIRKYINVCNSTSTVEKNCSICIKCQRTMTELEILGALDDFRPSFDIDNYRKHLRSREFADILCPGKATVYQRMMRDYAKRHGLNLRHFTTRVDLICAWLHGSWIYRTLKNLHLLDLVKKIGGRGK